MTAKLAPAVVNMLFILLSQQLIENKRVFIEQSFGTKSGILPLIFQQQQWYEQICSNIFHPAICRHHIISSIFFRVLRQ